MDSRQARDESSPKLLYIITDQKSNTAGMPIVCKDRSRTQRSQIGLRRYVQVDKPRTCMITIRVELEFFHPRLA